MTQQFAERATNVAPTGARNADLSDLVRILEDGQRRKLDVIAPASALRMHEGTCTSKESSPRSRPAV
ncbi:hypothetical protein QF037_010162 [Streptomyces canus]|uniref:hypothetical protein n=1 Tax=Streptomyces canus TaxID=58343 RepID=UPI0027829DD8|nr:hypothetical protein [Streptomyces canus]MDQ0605729.1 hypothetical protein [Streptomyces canus]